MVKYGVVGVGYFGAELARILKRLDDAEVTVVYDPENGKKIADELGCDAASSLDELVEREDVDTVVVATPNYLHKEPVIKAAQHGKNVFCEKPIALNYQDCDEMVRTCEENKVTFMAGHIMNFFHGVQRAKELINEGVIGKVLYCHSATVRILEENPRKIWRSFIPSYS